MAPDNQTATTPIETLESALLHKLEQGELDLPLLPQVASQVMALTSDPSADAARLSSLIHPDQALAAHVLRIANSPAYVPRSPIVSLQHAVAMLGINLLSEIAFTASLKALFSVGCYTELENLLSCGRQRLSRKSTTSPPTSPCCAC